MNKQASQVFCKQDIMTTPSFYLFTDGQETKTHGVSMLKSKHLSLADLLSQRIEVIAN